MSGTDVRTTRAKAFLIDRAGQILTSAIAEYPMFTPRPLRAEQQLADWWVATASSARQVLAEAGIEPGWVAGVRLTG